MLGTVIGLTLIAAELSAQAPTGRPRPVARPPANAPGGAAPRAIDPRITIGATPQIAKLPQVTYGDPIQDTQGSAEQKLGRVAAQTITARVRAASLSKRILQLNGRQGIDGSNLPDGARRLLAMHVRKLPLHASQYYFVDADAAAQWAATHVVPADIAPRPANENSSDCGTVSINGIVDCADDAAQAVVEEFERARKRAEDWWNEATSRLAQAANEGVDCYSDHTLPGPTTPVKFSIAPSMTLQMNADGSAGEVSGSATLTVPMQGDYQAKVEFLYIPCLPFAYRPKSVTAEGSLVVGEQLSVDAAAAGKFEKRFTIPPKGGPRIPLYVIPIVIGDAPVALLDVSAYIEGEVDVRGAGKASGKFTVTSSHSSAFAFNCSGQGCTGSEKSTTGPTTTSQSAQVEGQLAVQPGIFAGLQLSLNYNVLQGRAGVQPYLLGVANGCSSIAMQSSGGTPEKSGTALTADIDWGAKLRAEALAGGTVLGQRWEHKLIPERHIWFGDLASGGSSALVPSVESPAQAAAAQPAAVRVKMPGCYPYTSTVQYRVTWTGAAHPADHPACKWDRGTGVCTGDPRNELTFTLNWANGGTYTVGVQLVRDAHRVFSPAPSAAQLQINVASPAGGTP